MSASLKHKILTLALTFLANSALASHNQYGYYAQTEAGISADCTSCLLGAAETSPLRGQNNLLHKITLFSRDGVDHRHYANDSDRSMFASVGDFETQNEISETLPDGAKIEGKSQGTAFLISPCIIQSDYHAVFGDEVPSNDPHAPNGSFHYAVNFNVGKTQSGKGFKYHNLRATPFAWGDPKRENGYSTDYVYLKLDSDKCVGNDPEVHWLDVMPMSESDLYNSVLTTVGYPKDKEPADHDMDNKQLVKVDECHIQGMIPIADTYSTNCSGDYGSSGSPVIKMVDGKPKVVGVVDRTYGSAQGVQRLFDVTFANSMMGVGIVQDEVTRKYGGSIISVVQSDITRHSSQAPVQIASGNATSI